MFTNWKPVAWLAGRWRTRQPWFGAPGADLDLDADLRRACADLAAVRARSGR